MKHRRIDSMSEPEKENDFEVDLDRNDKKDEYEIMSYSDMNDMKRSYQEDLVSHSDGLDHSTDNINSTTGVNSKYAELKIQQVDMQAHRFFKRVWLAMIIIIAVSIAIASYPGAKDMFATDRIDKTPVSVSIPSGCTHAEVAAILAESKAIDNERFFKLYLDYRKTSTKFTKGDYRIPQNLSYAEVVSYITNQENRTDSVMFTITEGLNIEEIGKLLQENNICSKDEFIKVCNSDEFDASYKFLAEIPNSKERYYKLEGYIYPDTYKLYLESDPRNVVKKCLTNYKNKVIDNYSGISGLDGEKSIEGIAKEKGFSSMDEVIILASIIQAEAADTNDMRIISGIIQKRLSEQYKASFPFLGLDCTVYYPYRTKESAPENYESKYNTYKVQGLPLGAICNPGMDAIYAILEPSQTNYMYFAHDKNGKAYYASNEQGHIANLNRIS